MPAPPRRFAIVLLTVLTLSGVAGWIYSQRLALSLAAAAPLLAAFLIEIACWVAILWGGLLTCAPASNRRHGPGWPPTLVLPAAALAPYLAYSIPAGVFRLSSLLEITALVLAAVLWYRLLPDHPLTDLGFLALIAGVTLAHLLGPLYPSPVPKPKVDILGDLMWKRTGIAAALFIRGVRGTGFGFIPTRRDWRIGAIAFLCFVPPGVALTLWTGFARFHAPEGPWWRIALIVTGTFVGMLWAVALSEEFFFRGLLQNWLTKWTSNAPAGLLLASVVFGLAHLPFRQFPNWRFALLATLAGLFYGWAFQKAASIRAAMVAHALVNVMWRVFFG